MQPTHLYWRMLIRILLIEFAVCLVDWRCCMPVCLYACMPVCLYACMPVCLFAWLAGWLAIYSDWLRGKEEEETVYMRIYCIYISRSYIIVRIEPSLCAISEWRIFIYSFIHSKVIHSFIHSFIRLYSTVYNNLHRTPTTDHHLQCHFICRPVQFD